MGSDFNKVATLFQFILMIKSCLEIKQLKLLANLGLSEEERSSPQEIEIDIKILFKELPKACNSDEIKDTICYAKLCLLLEQICKNSAFKLIEHLTMVFYQNIKKITNDSIVISVKKCKPPIKNLEGGAIFTIAD